MENSYITNKKVEEYCTQKSTTSSEAVKALSEYTFANHPQAHMISGDLVAALFKFLIETTQVKEVLEIGTFTGYSALVMAEALPAGGSVITIDKDASTSEIAKSFWAKSQHGKKITALFGDAREIVKGLDKKFDMIFIDADKKAYKHYLEYTLPLLSDNGFILADNVLWRGEVANEISASDHNACIAMREFNDYIASRSDLTKVLLPLRDGLYLIKKVK